MTFVQQAIKRNKMMIDRALGSVPTGTDLVLATPRFPTSLNVIYLILDESADSPVLVIKRARDHQATEGLAHEASLLRRVSGFRVNGAVTTPQLIAEESSAEGSWIIETAVTGTMLTRRIVRRNLQSCLHAGMTWCSCLHAYSVSQRDGSSWRTSQENLLHSVLSIPVVVKNQRLVDATYDCISAVSGLGVPSVVEHCDLSHPNLFLSPDNVLGVVDWELGDEQGLPLCDMFFFIAFVAASVDGPENSAEYEGSFASTFVGSKAWAADLLREYREKLQISRDVARNLFLLCWFRQFANFAKRALQACDKDVLELSSASDNRQFLYWQMAFDNFDALNV